MSESSTLSTFTTSVSTPRIAVSIQNAIIIGVCVGLAVIFLLVIFVTCIWRKRCRSDIILEKTILDDDPVLKPTAAPAALVLTSSSPRYPGVDCVRLTPGRVNNKVKVVRSHSNPHPRSRRGQWRRAVIDDPIPRPIYINADHYREYSNEYRQHQLDVFKEGVRNAETVNKGGTAEARHRHITQITFTPASAHAGSYCSQPASRANSIARPTRPVAPCVPVRRIQSVYNSGPTLHIRLAGRRVVSRTRSARSCIGPL